MKGSAAQFAAEEVKQAERFGDKANCERSLEKEIASLFFLKQKFTEKNRNFCKPANFLDADEKIRPQEVVLLWRAASSTHTGYHWPLRLRNFRHMQWDGYTWFSEKEFATFD